MKFADSLSSIFMFALVFFALTAFAENSDERMNKLEETVNKQELLIQQQQETIEKLKAVFSVAVFSRIPICRLFSIPFIIPRISRITSWQTGGYPALRRRDWTSVMASTSTQSSLPFSPLLIPISTSMPIYR